jgi:hypothetical protein
MECWKERNIKEHEMDNTPNKRSKEKQIEELKWLMTKKREKLPKA